MNPITKEVRDNAKKVTPGWIKRRLKEKQLNNRKLAYMMNVGEPQISRWLSGQRNPNLINRITIYEYLK